MQEFIERRDIKPLCRDHTGYTAIEYAITSHKDETVRLLLSYGEVRSHLQRFVSDDGFIYSRSLGTHSQFPNGMKRFTILGDRTDRYKEEECGILFIR